MSRTHYYSVNNDSMKDITEEIEEDIKKMNEEAELAETETAINEPEEVIKTEEKETAVGVVTGCAKLNIREAPSITSKVVCVVAENSALLIEEDNPDSDWYNVYTETGFNGYCMKKYVSITR